VTLAVFANVARVGTTRDDFKRSPILNTVFILSPPQPVPAVSRSFTLSTYSPMASSSSSSPEISAAPTTIMADNSSNYSSLDDALEDLSR
jgi:hypothetical protein